MLIIKKIIPIRCIPITTIFSTIFLYGCFGSSDNVSLTVTQPNQCVTNIIPKYEADAYDIPSYGNIPSLHSNGFPQNNLLPPKSSLCTTVTISNNNHGHSPNGIIVVGNGLTLEYNINNTNIHGSLYDPKAANHNSIKSLQQIAGIAVFDPHNCLTTQGKYQHILDQKHSCDFYLQIVDANPTINNNCLTNNKLHFSLEYFNGETLYNKPIDIEYKNEIIAINNDNQIISFNTNTNKITNLNLAIKDNIIATINDRLGHLYIFTKNNIYIYNGEKIIYQFTSPIINKQFISDNKGNIFISNDTDIYVFNITMIANKEYGYKVNTNFNNNANNKIKFLSIINEDNMSTVNILVNNNQIYQTKIDDNYHWNLLFNGETMLPGKELYKIYNDSTDNNIIYSYDFKQKKLNTNKVKLPPHYDSNHSELIAWGQLNHKDYFVLNQGDAVFYVKNNDVFEYVDDNNQTIAANHLNGVLSSNTDICFFGDQINIKLNSKDNVAKNVLCINIQNNIYQYLNVFNTPITALSQFNSFKSTDY